MNDCTMKESDLCEKPSYPRNGSLVRKGGRRFTETQFTEGITEENC
jgi:hypothetical protein